MRRRLVRHPLAIETWVRLPSDLARLVAAAALYAVYFVVGLAIGWILARLAR